jgi:hypothetical protein
MSGAYADLKLLKHKSWTDVSSIDLWLLDMWRTISRPRFRYLPTIFIPPIGHKAVNRQEIDHFRSFFPSLPPTDTPCPQENVLLVLNTGPELGKSGNHFCVLAFVPSSRLIYVIGRRHDVNKGNYDDKDWASWDGKRILTRICALFGWDETWETLKLMRLCSVDWVQNGYDCGPIACQVCQLLMQDGLRLDTNRQWRRPRLPCCHLLRRKMAERVNELVWIGFQDFDEMETEAKRRIDATLLDDWIRLMNALRLAFEQDPASEVKTVIQDLDKAMRKCPHCHAMLEEIKRKRSAAICPVPIRKKSMKVAEDARTKELLKGTKSMAALVREGEEGSEVLREERAKVEEESKKIEDEGSEPDIPTEAFVFGDCTQARIGRFPRPKAGPSLPAVVSLRGRQLPFQKDFDGYYDDGPTLSDLQPVPQEIMGYDASLVYLANRITMTPWTLFKDYGYRLMPNFAQNFYLGKPVLFKEHLCPVGLPDPPDSITAYHAERFGREGGIVDTNDIVHMGAKELLKQATAEFDETVILRGMTVEDKYILLDLQRDAVQPENILYSCDIDSLIWITQTPKFMGGFGIYASPRIRDKAPIWKNNYVLVDLLFPQSDEDREEGGMREEWWTKPFSLSNIPHLSFGVLQQGSPIVEILLFFPRMTHKHPFRHCSETLIPKHIQDIFWDRVILPAIRYVLPETAAAYFPLDRAHSKFKQGLGKGNTTGTPVHILQGPNMSKLVEEMKVLVSRRTVVNK